jgi:hypothetical protein
VYGIHEVTGSIPVSSTNSDNNSAGWRIPETADLSISRLFSPERPERPPET